MRVKAGSGQYEGRAGVVEEGVRNIIGGRG